MNSGVTQQPLPQRGGQDAAARRKRRRATASTRYTEYARFADDLAILIGAHPRHDWPMRVEKRLREELAKLQVEIYEVRRDKSSIKGGDDWGRGIMDDLKDSDWVPQSSRDIRYAIPASASAFALHGRGGAIATVHIERATGRPCGCAYVLRDSLAIICSRGCAAQWCDCQKITEASPAWRSRGPRHTHAGPQRPLAVSRVPDTQQLSNAFSPGQSPEPSAATDKAC
jgi:hypothetical protein